MKLVETKKTVWKAANGIEYLTLEEARLSNAKKVVLDALEAYDLGDRYLQRSAGYSIKGAFEWVVDRAPDRAPNVCRDVGLALIRAASILNGMED